MKRLYRVQDHYGQTRTMTKADLEAAMKRFEVWEYWPAPKGPSK